MAQKDSRHGEPQPKIHYVGTVTSCIDVAFDKADSDTLYEWDSVVAKNQTSGRGQMRRKWVSIEGNLFAALRLPMRAPFDSTEASVAIGALCINSLQNLGYPLMLKWPNDLILVLNKKQFKMCGILVEEKHDALIVGIGLNTRFCPTHSEQERDYGLPIGALSMYCGEGNLPSSDELWRELVQRIYALYVEDPEIDRNWKIIAESCLLWRRQRVVIEDHNERIEGVLQGLSKRGGALLQTPDGVVEKLSGSMRLAGK